MHGLCLHTGRYILTCTQVHCEHYQDLCEVHKGHCELYTRCYQFYSNSLWDLYWELSVIYTCILRWRQSSVVSVLVTVSCMHGIMLSSQGQCDLRVGILCCTQGTQALIDALWLLYRGIQAQHTRSIIQSIIKSILALWILHRQHGLYQLHHELHTRHHTCYTAHGHAQKNTVCMQDMKTSIQKWVKFRIQCWGWPCSNTLSYLQFRTETLYKYTGFVGQLELQKLADKGGQSLA